ncbi:FKBP-type peptidyl-prolyl cis-trans isomerase [Pararhodonellum marinum]|uniref:FKBP-type peptidyl-prolyl cis-trans isomerase n=1 Tax=Pararhodonellum marinum TaxID=2755358 RepID=UPI00188FCFA2|nr:FKBP-type peptidyl-prolyl cis-trans isomerase [Pararhodonellum marinum]
MNSMDNENNQIVERENQRLKEYLESNNLSPQITEAGYYYTKDETFPDADPIINNSRVGIYYEIKTLDGKLIDSHMDESKDPVFFLHGEPGMVPRVINFAVGLAKEGESITVYAPSHLGYFNYGYQQLILPYSNLIIKLKVAEVLSEEECKIKEDDMIQAYISENELEGFEKLSDGIYLKIVEEGNAASEVSKNESLVDFTFSIYHFNEAKPFAEIKTGSSPARIVIGATGNLEFMNKGFKGLKKGAKVELISPSHLSFGNTTQVIPFSIREDLYAKGYINSMARPMEPILMKAHITEVK